MAVAPLAGAWIEIRQYCEPLPYTVVAPLAGAWIEILFVRVFVSGWYVAPLAGAWIEIKIAIKKFRKSSSLPSRERGLK